MTLIAFLRGINVGGNHKVPMADLRNKMTKRTYTLKITPSPLRGRGLG